MNFYPQNMGLILPKWLGNQPVVVYLGALIGVSLLFSGFALPWYYMLSGIVAVLLFFMGSQRLSKSWGIWKMPKEKTFEKNIFWVAFSLRVAWMLLIYFIFQANYGDAFGFDNADSNQYHAWGKEFAKGILGGKFIEVWNNNIASGIDISDLGYASYVGLVYALTNDSILALRLIKCLWSALTCVLIYRLAKSNFGEETGRLAAIFCMLWPNFWYYCGAHLKEVEMVFLGTLFVEQADQMLKTRNFSVWKIIPVLLISGALFTIRTPLAIVTVLCLLFSVVMSSSKVVGWTKRIAVGFLALLLVGVTMGNRIAEEARGLIDTAQSDNQQKNMEWRAERKDASGNTQKFAKYAGKTVFAPLIFSIPFPTMVRPFDGQEVQQLLNGGNYIKNIVSFFTILSMFMLLFSGKWRRHLVPLSYMLGYLVVLVMSVFAQSERFHQPAMPMEMLFAAYGITQVLQGVRIKGIGGFKTYKTWFVLWLGVMFIAAFAWNWFKLAGRGLV